MFKKRNTDRQINLQREIEDIGNDESPTNRQPILVPKSLTTKKINKFSNHGAKNIQIAPQPRKPVIVKYGLIDKDEVNSKYHANQQADEQKQPQKHSIVGIYVRRKMEELAEKEAPDRQSTANVEEIMQMQKKYLEMSQQKLAEYDIAEILKKLENMATQAIKAETDARNNYLKNLLENQHEKMEYASKKELKTIRQQKERTENQLRNKYNDSGRRGYVEKVKYQAMLGK